MPSFTTANLSRHPKLGIRNRCCIFRIKKECFRSLIHITQSKLIDNTEGQFTTHKAIGKEEKDR